MARDGPLTAGLQLRDPQLAGALRKPGQQLWRETQSKLSYAVAYSPAGPAIGGLPPLPCLSHGLATHSCRCAGIPGCCHSLLRGYNQRWAPRILRI